MRHVSKDCSLKQRQPLEPCRGLDYEAADQEKLHHRGDIVKPDGSMPNTN